MPTVDFSTHDPNFGPDQEQQCARIVAAVRALNSKVVRLGGSRDALAAAADRVEALVDSLDDVTQTRAMESYRFAFDLEHPNDVIPFNPATGAFNPMSPKLELHVDGQKLVALCTFANCFESLAYATMIAGVTGPTLWLRVAYLKPTPINEPLRFECEVMPSEGKKYTADGACYHGEHKVSEAEALMLASYEIELRGGTDR
jgi:hypothetical protein